MPLIIPNTMEMKKTYSYNNYLTPKEVKRTYSNYFRSKTNSVELHFKILFYAFFLDYGFVKFKSFALSVLVKALFLILTIAITVLGVQYYILIEHFLTKDLGLLFLLECFLYVFLTTVNNKFTLHDFHEKMLEIDTQLKVKSDTYKNVKYLIIFMNFLNIICLSFTFIILPFTQYSLFDTYFEYFITFGPLCRMIVPSSTYVLMYVLVFCRVRQLSLIIKNDKNVEDIIDFQKMYKFIIDYTECCNNAYDNILLTLILCNIPKLLLMLLILILLLRHQVGLMALIVTSTLMLTTCMQLFAPAIAAGMVTAEAENIQIILHNKLIKYRGKPQHEDILFFIKYIKARPFKFYVFKEISFGWSFPILVLNICVTYVIVIVQFTHLY